MLEDVDGDGSEYSYEEYENEMMEQFVMNGGERLPHDVMYHSKQ